MEGPMDNQITKQNNEHNYHLESSLEDKNGISAAGYWFAAAALFAFLAAGVILYRTGLSNDVSIAAQSNRMAPGPILPHG
jgi:purine-cytosine permease-like protein